ncbi:MAG: hypothetical protein KIT44_06590 [Opitutaceae bacterium]|nr:hypothetical protein [Opitutaceae bacterium]
MRSFDIFARRAQRLAQLARDERGRGLRHHRGKLLGQRLKLRRAEIHWSGPGERAAFYRLGGGFFSGRIFQAFRNIQFQPTGFLRNSGILARGCPSKLGLTLDGLEETDYFYIHNFVIRNNYARRNLCDPSNPDARKIFLLRNTFPARNFTAMTNFGSFLGQVIAADFDGSQKRFSDACGIKPPQITRYIRNGEIPAPERLGQMIHAVSDSVKKVDLYAAYLADIQARMDGGLAFRVDVRLKDAAPAKVNRELEEALEKLRQRALRNPKFLRIVRDFSEWPV